MKTYMETAVGFNHATGSDLSQATAETSGDGKKTLLPRRAKQKAQQPTFYDETGRDGGDSEQDSAASSTDDSSEDDEASLSGTDDEEDDDAEMPAAKRPKTTFFGTQAIGAFQPPQ